MSDKAISDALQQLIASAIVRAGGKIPFSQYMEMALYTPNLGYYRNGLTKFGKNGDFITAPSQFPLFNLTLGRFCAEILKPLQNETTWILEVGSGQSQLASTILPYLERHNIALSHYAFLELSADLNARNHEALITQIPQYQDKLLWLTELPKKPVTGIILLNEVLDAMPVDLFEITATGVQQQTVVKKNGHLTLAPETITDPNLQQAIDEIISDIQEPLPTPYTSEVNLRLPAFIRALNNSLQQGVMLFIDYGFPRHEYYHPSRHMGTLMCHYHHLAHHDLFHSPGLQDITAHVDFTALAKAATAVDLTIAGFTNQAFFLLDNGILDCAEEMQDPYLAKQQLQFLTYPHEMGELFKVMALSRQMSTPIPGFKIRDFCDRL